jgi:hypothetical protein
MRPLVIAHRIITSKGGQAQAVAAGGGKVLAARDSAGHWHRPSGEAVTVLAPDGHGHLRVA